MPLQPDPIDRDTLLRRACLATFEQHAEVTSTMERAREIALDHRLPLPAAVVADRQTLGRGRQGARWWQPPGSLAVSLVLDAASAGLVAATAQPQPTWSLACGVALAEAVAAIEPGIVPLVRWPNDLDVRGRKLAGILVETTAGGRAIFGIGVNTTGSAAAAPAALRQRIATMPDLAGRAMSRETLLVEFLPRLLRLLAEITADPGVLVERYRPLCALTGRDVTVYRGVAAGVVVKPISGHCLGIDTAGALMIETVAGRLHLASGSLTHPADVWHGADDATRGS